MAKIQWDQTGERLFETGVDHGVLYVRGASGDYEAGVAWNGLTAVTESPSGAEASPQYADNMKYLNLVSAEEFAGTIEAFTNPDEFEICNRSAALAPGVSIGQQPRREFGFVWRTKIGNDTEGQNHGYKLHIAYGALAGPSEKAYATINESPEATAFSWEFTTTPVEVEGFAPTAKLTFSSLTADPTALAALEALLYGDETNEAALPTPAEIAALFAPVGP